MIASGFLSTSMFLQACLLIATPLLPLSTLAQSQSLIATLDSIGQPIHLQAEQEAGPGRLRGDLSPSNRNTALIAAGVGFWTVTFLLFDEPVQKFSQHYRSTLTDHIVKVVEPLGRQGYLMPAAGVVVASGMLLRDEKLQKVGIVSVGSILVNAAATSTLKRSFGRHRPDVSPENDRFDGPFRNTQHNSLPSSHTSTAFTVATSVATVYREHKLIPPLAYGVATLVGLSRVHDNVHWATDVMKGAAVGYLSAKGVNYLYELANQRLMNRKQKLLMAPNLGPGNAGFSATLVF
ncbi:phosphatase PAP2 family protein [Pontibacter locisalis]|uniref:Phosphatase PAP2 family protein n=1 Tax=Pontibacter locisalis TaxID=1719035 RepID=A0ABW5IP90_9BACT